MRRLLLALATVVAVLAIGGCGSTPAVWVTPGTGPVKVACTTSCTDYTAVLHWGPIVWGHTTVGYNALFNGVKIGTTTARQFMFGTSPALMQCSKTYNLGVQAYDSTGDTSQVLEDAYPTPACPGTPANTVLPAITGTATSGDTLTASTGTWTESPTSYTYQWRDCNGSGALCRNITGATASTYFVQVSDVSKTIRVIVTATNGNGSASATSNQTSAVTFGGRDCFESPGACGFPDPNYAWGADPSAWTSGGGGVGPNDGTSAIPCSSLPSSGSVTTSTDGQTISNLNIVNGSISVENANVTIDNVCITSSGGIGSHSVDLTSAATNLTIENSTLGGVGPGSGTCTSVPTNPCDDVESPVSNVPGATGLVMSHDYLYWCSECVHSPGTIEDSYLISNGQQGEIVDGMYAVAHYEDTYTCGGTITANHDTMFNPFNQTGDMFMDTNVCGSAISFTAENSLFAGGGWLMYPVDTPGETTATISITNNRFARCVTTPIFNPGSGGTACTDGADEFGYFPLGGYFSTIYECPSVGLTFTGNVWDDNDATAACG